MEFPTGKNIQPNGMAEISLGLNKIKCKHRGEFCVTGKEV
jgi:hypothetical protein